MLQYFKNLVVFVSDESSNPQSETEKIHLAAAVLLVEVMMADHEVKEEELNQIVKVLETLFSVKKEQSALLIDEARHRHEELVSLHELTSVINEQRDQELKRKLVFAMWCISFSDDDKDKYEEHLIRKVADLLYLSHSDFIQARHKALSHCNSGEKDLKKR